MYNVYNGSEFAVIDGSDVYDWFEIKTGIKQGCCMSSFLFLPIMAWVTRRTTTHGNTGIRWKFSSFMEDLDFAYDLTLISGKREHIQTKVNSLGGYRKMRCLKISKSKTVMMRWNSPTSGKIQVDGEELEEVLTFVYLGATVTQK